MMNKEIQKGDRIFARLTMGRRVILEFMINRVSSFTDLLNEVREMTGGLRGLGRLQIRNQSRGWSHMHNLMFYGDATGDEAGNFGNIGSDCLFESGSFSRNGQRVEANPQKSQMLFPWECH